MAKLTRNLNVKKTISLLLILTTLILVASTLKAEVNDTQLTQTNTPYFSLDYCKSWSESNFEIRNKIVNIKTKAVRILDKKYFNCTIKVGNGIENNCSKIFFSRDQSHFLCKRNIDKLNYKNNLVWMFTKYLPLLYISNDKIISVLDETKLRSKLTKNILHEIKTINTLIQNNTKNKYLVNIPCIQDSHSDFSYRKRTDLKFIRTVNYLNKKGFAITSFKNKCVIRFKSKDRNLTCKQVVRTSHLSSGLNVKNNHTDYKNMYKLELNDFLSGELSSHSDANLNLNQNALKFFISNSGVNKAETPIINISSVVESELTVSTTFVENNFYCDGQLFNVYVTKQE